MRVALVGPELEENLGLRYLHSSLVAAGHGCRIIEFHAADQTDAVISGIIEWGADVAGLSMVFTARAREFTDLALRLRAKGFAGHIVAGGHFASFHAADLLRDFPAFDFMVHGEGESTLVDLIANLRAPAQVAGISYRTPSGSIYKTDPRPNPADLDILPPPTRTPPFYSYLGMPIANILGSRGCFGSCRFCSITAWYRENTGPKFRQRSVSSIVFEMAQLYFGHGVRIFNFHDDTFFLPSESRNLERFGEMERALRSRGMTDIAIQVKARTDAITPAVLQALRRIGLFRVFLGVENNSPAGLVSLGKGTTVGQNRTALELLRAEKLHVSFNLLMFGPDTTMDQIAENAACIRDFADMPVNFGRTEVYSGTPMEHDLRLAGRLKGDYFGYYYDIADQRVQNAFEVFRTVFTERNFQTGGMNFVAMKLDYHFQILRHFFPHRADAKLFGRKRRLLERLNFSNADCLSAICENTGLDEVQNARLAGSLLDRRRNDDRVLAAEFASLIAEIEQRARRRSSVIDALPRKAAALTAAAALVLTVQQCTRDNGSSTVGGPDTNTQKPDSLARFDSTETALITSRIDSVYRSAIDSLGLAHGYANLPLQFNLGIDSAGKVDSCSILQPSADSTKPFTDSLHKLIAGWNFPDITRKGICGIMMIVVPVDTLDWHVSEIIAYPYPPVPAKDTIEFTLTSFDSAETASIERRVRDSYLAGLDSIAASFGKNTVWMQLWMSVDSSGAVTDHRIENAQSADSTFHAMISGLIGSWTFPGVHRTGSCMIGFYLNYLDWHMCEVMPVPVNIEYNATDSSLIRDRIASTYQSSIDSLGYNNGYVDRPVTIVLTVDATGAVSADSVVDPAVSAAVKFVTGMNQLMGGWTFPGVSCAGRCTLTLTVARIEPSVSEIMAFPRN